MGEHKWGITLEINVFWGSQCPKIKFVQIFINVFEKSGNCLIYLQLLRL